MGMSHGNERLGQSNNPRSRWDMPAGGARHYRALARERIRCGRGGRVSFPTGLLRAVTRTINVGAWGRGRSKSHDRPLGFVARRL